MKLKFLASLVAFASISWMPVAQAQMQIPTPTNNWVAVGATHQGDVALVDAGTVSRSGGYAGYWLQINYANNSASRLYTFANCSNSSYQPVWAVSANSQGQITQNESVSYPASFVPSGSLAETTYRYACFGSQDPLSARIATQAKAITRAMNNALNAGR